MVLLCDDTLMIPIMTPDGELYIQGLVILPVIAVFEVHDVDSAIQAHTVH